MSSDVFLAVTSCLAESCSATLAAVARQLRGSCAAVGAHAVFLGVVLFVSRKSCGVADSSATLAALRAHYCVADTFGCWRRPREVVGHGVVVVREGSAYVAGGVVVREWS